jgi:DNA repair protein RadC
MAMRGGDVRPLALRECLGIPARAALILAGAMELRSRGTRDLEGGELLTPEAVFSWARSRVGHLEHEEVWTLATNAKSQLRSIRQIGRGGISGTSLLPRDILGPLLRDGASAFVLLHNHPSGDPEPSEQDLEMTRELEVLATRLGVPLLDHVIVARDRFVSLFREGYLTPPRRQLVRTVRQQP